MSGGIDVSKRREKVGRARQEDQEYRENPFLTTLPYTPDEYQKRYQQLIRQFPVVAVDAEAGTGKTTLAVYEAFEALRRKKSDKIVYMRFVDDKYLSQGFLPGDLEEKERLLFYPFFDALEEINIPYQRFKVLKEKGIIELRTDTTERGRNRKGTFLIVDEGQNARTFADLVTVFTRLHDIRGQSVLIGHSGQVDNKRVELTAQKRLNPFQAFIIHMLKKPFTQQAFLKHNYRGEISRWADKFYETVNQL